MSVAKHDRQGVRKASDIEQKYDLNQESSLQAAANAQRAAERASLAVDALDKSLDKEELTARLTEETGVLTSADGSLQIDLVNGTVTAGKLTVSNLTVTTLTVTSLVIAGKTASWKDNGDDTYTLVGS